MRKRVSLILNIKLSCFIKYNVVVTPALFALIVGEFYTKNSTGQPGVVLDFQ